MVMRLFGSMDQFSTEKLTAEKLHEDHLADLVALHLDPEGVPLSRRRALARDDEDLPRG